jgi:hypothetical protein
MLLPIMMFADSYTVLWKRVTDAQAKDLPQTQANVLRQIADKAAWDKEYGQLLKAQLMLASVNTQVSPDSAEVEIARLEQLEQQTKDAVLRAVYDAVLGNIYAQRQQRGKPFQAVSQQWYAKAMANPRQLAQHKCAEYKPAVVEGIDSKIFNDDLLHVIGFMAGDYATLQQYYQGKGYRAAALMSALQGLQQSCTDKSRKANKSRYLLQLDTLTQQYGDLLEAGEVAIARYQYLATATDVTIEERVNYINYALARWGAWPRMNILRNALSDLQQPSFIISVGDYMMLPGKQRKVYINNLRNISTLNINIYKIHANGDTRLSPDNKDDYARLVRAMDPVPVQTVSRRYVGMPAWKEVGDSLFLDPLPVGVYLIEATTDNNNIEPRRELLRVSNLYVMYEALPDKHLRMAVVDATTGKAVQGAHVRLTLTDDPNAEKRTVTELVTDKNGEADYKYDNRVPRRIYVYTDDDKASNDFLTSNTYYYYWEGDKEETRLQLFTDRSLYRPGQTVHVAGIMYHVNHDLLKSETLNQRSIPLRLMNVNGELVDEQTLVTDEYGKVSTDFTLPLTGLTGGYTVIAQVDKSYAVASFNVEQYKRPTFQVEFDNYDKRFQLGDTVVVRGLAKSYAGVPVRGAKVSYTVERRQSFFWRKMAGGANTVLLTDTVTTANDGSFEVKMPMEEPEDIDPDRPFYYQVQATAKVTDPAGETHEATMSLPLSNRSSVLSTDLPARSVRDELKTLTITRQNAAGEPIAGTVAYRFDQEPWLTTQANKSVDLDTRLAPGLHVLEAVCEDDTLRQQVVVFNLNDKHPVIETPDWYYLSANQFSDSKPVYVQYGSSDDITQVYYTIFSGNKVLEHGTRVLNKEVTTRRLTYKKEYGDGITITLAWVKNGKLYSHSDQIMREQPNQQLKLTWKTFRDKLTPGQKEEWTLNITDPDGKPAHAQLMAAMYDKSLDAISQHQWTFDTNYRNSIPYVQWAGGSFDAICLYGFQSYKALTEHSLDFSHFDESMFQFSMPDTYYHVRFKRYDSAIGAADMLGAAPMAASKVMVRGAKAMAPTNLMVEQQTVESEGAVVTEEKAQQTSTQVRENLNETAFFYPALTTDKEGNVGIRFTLPESVTTWRFMGLAHDKTVNKGMLSAEATASKTVMVQPNLPRFIRTGDKARVSTRIHNTSDRKVNGTARLQLLTPGEEKVISEWTAPFTAEANQSAYVTFDVDAAQVATRAKGENLLVAKVVAEGRGFSDGEQHYLGLLPDKEFVTTTVPFTQIEPGVKTVDLSKLFPTNEAGNRLTIEYTNNPAWLMVQALPTLANPNSNNAISLATAIYANSIGRSILTASPLMAQTVKAWQQETGAQSALMSSLQTNEELKTMVLSETPWVAEARNEAEQKQQLIGMLDENTIGYRLNSFAGSLSALQNADGSFSWWPEMPGSNYVTMTVVDMFTRLNSMLGVQKAYSNMLQAAFGYLDKSVANEVAELKKLEKKGTKRLVPSELACHYLYANALAGRKETADITYLVNLLEAMPTELTIYGKAGSAVILSQYGKTRKAAEYLQSLNEYTVYKEEMGRYFDTKRAQYSWCDYRIPTQVAAIEALKMLTPDDHKTITEMQRWLLQEKRTQAWDTPINSVNAIYAFLADAKGTTDLSKLVKQEPTTLKVDGKALELPTAMAGLGYVKTTVPTTRATTFTAEKTSTGTSWGAVYAQFWQKTTEVKDAGEGLKVKREVVTADGKTNPDALKVGDKVNIRITITADRDFDFVQVQDKRAACMEPATQLSGYRFGYYCAPQDNVTNYYFDRLAKGQHVIETTYYIDREGEYSSGVCTAQCAYSPAFSARTAAGTIKVVK